MDKENRYFNEVVNNGIDFINKAISESRNANITEQERLKYSTITLYQGIELLLKSVLIREHWTLVLGNVDKCKPEDYERGRFYSVRYDTVITRLENCCGVKIDKDTDSAFTELKDLRNKYIHFHCNESKPAVICSQYRAWHYLFLLIVNQLQSAFGELTIKNLRKIEKEMLENNEFIDVRFQEIGPELERLRRKGSKIYSCPWCGQESIYPDFHEVLWPCLVCNTKYDPDDMKSKIYRQEYHPKHNPDFQIGVCDVCDFETVVPETSLGGSDEEKYLCLSCGAEHHISDGDTCSTCGRLFFGRELEAGMCRDCFKYQMDKD